MDSVHVKANASMDSLVEKEIIEDAAAYASSLKEDEDNSDNTSNHDPDEASSPNTVSARKHQEVQWHHGWKAKAYKGMPGGSGRDNKMDENGNPIRPKFVSNHTHYSTTDGDARVAVKPGKPRQLNYLGQVSVDTASHLITHIQADYADRKDSQCLPSLLGNTLNNLKAEGLIVEEVLADAGYSSGEALKALEANNITGFIPILDSINPLVKALLIIGMGIIMSVKEGSNYRLKR